MATTPLKVGGEIDAQCTQCKADRVHVIVAVVGQVPKRVQCLSCKGEHRYIATAAHKEAAAAQKRANRTDKQTDGARPSRVSRVSIGPASRRREEDLHASWEKAVVGKDFAAFKQYRIDKAFAKGDLIRHAKFGDGVVAAVIDDKKFEILFKDGMKMLAQSTQLS
jgi:hypothetical protein